MESFDKLCDSIDNTDNQSSKSGHSSSKVSSASGASSKYVVPVPPADDSISSGSGTRIKVRLSNDPTPQPLKTNDLTEQPDHEHREAMDIDVKHYIASPEAEMDRLKGASTVEALSDRGDEVDRELPDDVPRRVPNNPSWRDKSLANNNMNESRPTTNSQFDSSNRSGGPPMIPQPISDLSSLSRSIPEGVAVFNSIPSTNSENDDNCAPESMQSISLSSEGSISRTNDDVKALESPRRKKNACPPRRSEHSGPRRELTLKPYQSEISRSALDGDNDLILLPTGTGKTFVAIAVIRDHLETRMPSGSHCKIVFFVPTAELAKQQLVKIKDYIQPEYIDQCESITGPDNLSMGQLKKKVLDPDIKVLVVTPAIIENYFKSSETARVSDFTLLIFDECHHAKKKHPYRRLLLKVAAARLHLEPSQDKNEPDQDVPQLLGMTATTGVGDAKDIDSAMKFIIDMCSLFNLKTPPTRVAQTQSSLVAATNNPDEETIIVDEVRQDPVSEMIRRKLMKLIEEQMKQKALALDNFETIEFPQGRHSQQYEQYAINLCKKFKELHDENRKEEIMYCTLGLQYLQHFNRSLNIINLLSGEAGVKYIEETFGDPQYQSVESLWKLYYEKLPTLQRERAADKVRSNPKLEKLINTLESIIAKEPNSRVMVFVKERKVCHFLSEALKKRSSKFRPTAYTSAGPKSTGGGMNPLEQQAALAAFHSGVCNILVATSLAEEGIDIQACNATIRYMYVKDMIAKHQAKGRTRTFEGRFISIIDAKLQGQDTRNEYKRNLMVSCLKKLQGIDDPETSDSSDEEMDVTQSREFMSLLRQLSQRSFDFMEMLTRSNSELLEEVQRSLIDTSWTRDKLEIHGLIRCANCKNDLGDICNVKCFMDSHYLNMDKSFHQKVKAYPTESDMRSPSMMDGIMLYGQLRCMGVVENDGSAGDSLRHCGNHVANLVKVEGFHLGIWMVNNIAVESETGKLSTFKKWKMIKQKYEVKEIKLETLYHSGLINQFPAKELR